MAHGCGSAAWSAGILFAGFAEGFLGFANAFLNFAFDLSAGVSGGGSGDVVGFALDLVDFSGGDIFTGHFQLL
jgi:hypothetical protein